MLAGEAPASIDRALTGFILGLMSFKLEALALFFYTSRHFACMGVLVDVLALPLGLGAFACGIKELPSANNGLAITGLLLTVGTVVMTFLCFILR